MKEAKAWLESAEEMLKDTGRHVANVCCAQCIHALIRANDALTLKFLARKAKRHDEMPELFAAVADKLKMPKEHAGFKTLLQTAAQEKGAADYGYADFNWNDAKFYIEETRKFMAMAEKYVEGG